tara:strand:+ start:1951 stop:2658 length:708 start_codon:yes stop_codon:yes gene_type:complete
MSAGLTSRVLKPSKFEFSQAAVQNELAAEKLLDKSIANVVSDEAKGRQNEIKKKLTKLQKLYNESIFTDFTRLFSRNRGQLFPFSGLSDIEKLEATVRGCIAFVLIFIIYTNIGRIQTAEKYFPSGLSLPAFRKSIMWSNFGWIGLTLVTLGVVVYFMGLKLLKDIENVKTQLSLLPREISTKKMEMKSEFRNVQFENIIHNKEGIPMYENPQRTPLRQESKGMTTHMGGNLLPS